MFMFMYIKYVYVFDYRKMVHLKEVGLLLFCITSTQMINPKTCRSNNLHIGLYADDSCITCQAARYSVWPHTGDFKQCTQPAEQVL